MEAIKNKAKSRRLSSSEIDKRLAKATRTDIHPQVLLKLQDPRIPEIYRILALNPRIPDSHAFKLIKKYSTPKNSKNLNNDLKHLFSAKFLIKKSLEKRNFDKNQTKLLVQVNEEVLSNIDRVIVNTLISKKLRVDFSTRQRNLYFGEVLYLFAKNRTLNKTTRPLEFKIYTIAFFSLFSKSISEITSSTKNQEINLKFMASNRKLFTLIQNEVIPKGDLAIKKIITFTPEAFTFILCLLILNKNYLTIPKLITNLEYGSKRLEEYTQAKSESSEGQKKISAKRLEVQSLDREMNTPYIIDSIFKAKYRDNNGYWHGGE